MSDRERWIVYPLLFMALGMSWHDKIAPNHRVLTHDLIVVNDDERPAFRVKATPKGDAVVHWYRGDREIERLGPDPEGSGRQRVTRQDASVTWLSDLLRTLLGGKTDKTPVEKN